MAGIVFKRSILRGLFLGIVFEAFDEWLFEGIVLGDCFGTACLAKSETA